MSKKDFRNYFNKKKPVGGFLLIFISLLLFSISEGSSLGIIAFIVLASGAYKVYSHYSHQESAVDKYCEKLAEDYYCEKMNLVDSYKVAIEEEMHSYGFIFENMFSARLSRIGKNGIMRSSILEIVCVFFSKDMLYHYNKKISLITDEKTENNKELCISDIQAISTEAINQNIYVVIVVPGNEKIYIKCKDKNLAMEFCDNIKKKI